MTRARFTLLPFGGAGPLHACDLADALGIGDILIPPIPGVLSAYGMLVADIAADASQSVLQPADRLVTNLAPLEEIFTALRGRVAAVLEAEGVPAPRIEAALDMRYRGQSYELTVPLPTPISIAHLVEATSAFHAAHAQRYGYAMPDEPINVVNLRVRGIGPGAQAGLPELALQGEDASAARLADKPVWFSAAGPQPAACYDRSRLAPANRLEGPAIIYQFDATIVVSPAWRGRVDAYTDLWLERK